MCAEFLIIKAFTWFYPQHATMVVNGKLCARFTALDLRTNMEILMKHCIREGNEKDIHYIHLTFSSDLISQLDARCYLEEVSD